MITKSVVDKGYGLHKWKGSRTLHLDELIWPREGNYFSM